MYCLVYQWSLATLYLGAPNTCSLTMSLAMSVEAVVLSEPEVGRYRYLMATAQPSHYWLLKRYAVDFEGCAGYKYESYK